MKKSRKSYRAMYNILFAVIFFNVISCSSGKLSHLPKEFDLSQIIYNEEVSHIFGPGGINQSFIVCNLPQDVSVKIAKEGLQFLNLLPSSFDKAEYPWEDFKEWRTTPVINEKKWVRRIWAVEKNWKPSLANFFGDIEGRRFSTAIDLNHARSFQESIESSTCYYSYGGYLGMGILVIVPSKNLVYYLFRD